MKATMPLEEKAKAEPWAARAKRHLRVMAEWLFLGVLTGIACGVASAAFLHALDWATRFRVEHEALVYALPLAGLAVGVIYDCFGKPIKGGNNLVIDTAHEDSPQLPLRMGPMIAISSPASAT